MRVAYIATGAAGMVCGTCIHDNTLANALLDLGHEVALIPTYTPINTDENDVSIGQVFMGGVNVYLQEKFSLFRHTPAFIDNLLNGRRLLAWLSRFSASTSARELGAMTVSVLRGEDGHQRKEVMKLVRWLRDDYKPDIVQLNHSLILGFAREIKRQLNVPVVCGVQGEDLFLDSLVEPYKTQAFELLHEKIEHVDAVIATSDYYADYMADYIGVARDKFRTVYLGINADDFQGERQEKNDQIVLGYLGRQCPEKGLHLILEAFHRIWSKDRTVRLKIAGYLSPKDRRYHDDCRKKVEQWGMRNAVQFLGEVTRAQKIDFFKSIDIFSLPTVYKESKGLSILEAMASGVPVVQPEHGLFPEVVKKCGGGLLFKPESIDELTDKLSFLIEDEEARHTLGVAGQQAVRSHFNASSMAQGNLAVYESCL